jgi:hypothetical protein
MAKRGRKQIDPNNKQTLVRVYTKRSTIDLIGEDNIQNKCNEIINQLQAAALTKCANEALKSKSNE